MNKFYHYCRSYNYGDDVEEYVVKAENEEEALQKITLIKYRKGHDYIIAHLKHLKQVVFDEDDVIDLC